MKLLNNYLNKYGFLLFAITTFLIAIFRIPFWDEAHAFDISCLKISEIFYMTRIEGHFMLWFLTLKLFSNLNLYPFAMLIINWFFCALAIYILWKKAPFCPVIKFMISFSTPFLFYFAPVARCYSIGILFLFLICAFYPYRFKKPYLFSFLILILSNTSVMALIGGFYFGILFFFESIEKYKKGIFKKQKLVKIFLIFLLCAFLILSQTIGLRHSNIRGMFTFGNGFFSLVFKYSIIVSFVYFSFYFLKNLSKNTFKKALFLICSIYLTLTYIFLFCYFGNYWNHYFYFVYFIVFFWIFKKILFKDKLIKILFVLILFLSIFPLTFHKNGKFDYIYASKSNLIADYILKNFDLKNANLYSLDWWGDIVPCAGIYLARHGIKIYDINGFEKRSYESLKSLFYNEYKPFDFDKFTSVMNKEKNNYILTSELLKGLKMNNVLVIQKNNDFIFRTKNKKYFLKLVVNKKSELGLMIYKISEI